MAKKVEVGGLSDEVRRFFRELAAAGETYLVVEDQGRPLAGVVPSWQVGRLEEQREQLMSMLREVWSRNRDVPPEEIELEVADVVREVRAETRQ